jgi:hypothetical protein
MGFRLRYASIQTFILIKGLKCVEEEQHRSQFTGIRGIAQIHVHINSHDSHSEITLIHTSVRLKLIAKNSQS